MHTRLFLILLLAASAPAFSQLQSFQTTLNLQEPVVNSTGVDTVVFLWRTFEVAGSVNTFEVEDLIMRLYTDGVLRYTDVVVVDGVIQLFDGKVRVPEVDVFWDFNLETGGLEQMLNISSELAMLSTGEHYVVNDSVSIPDDGIVDVSRFVDGATVDGNSDFLNFQTTTPWLPFSDGFESGDFSQWTLALPESTEELTLRRVRDDH